MAKAKGRNGGVDSTSSGRREFNGPLNYNFDISSPRRSVANEGDAGIPGAQMAFATKDGPALLFILDSAQPL